MATGGRGGTGGGRTTGGGRLLPAPGASFDGIVVDRVLGEGGMGHLLLGREEDLDRAVAVKFLRRGLVGDAASERRFRREGRALAAVNHPHVVRVHRVGALEDWPYIVMEYVEGTPLAARLRVGPLPVEEALRVAEELASALAEVHGRRIAHRDLSPSNVMLRSGSGQVCLIDFGLSKPLDTTTQDSGGGMGTPYYMAPEQVTGRRVGLRSDVYSFGATLFEAVAGRPPHDAHEAPALFHAILNRDAPPLRSLVPGAPRSLEVLLARCLSRAPEFRPEDGDALLGEIRAVRGTRTSPLEATRVAESSPGGRPVPRDPSDPLPLLGRAEEVGVLRSGVEGAEAGRGAVVLLEGEPGTGKTRLLREAGRAARSRAAAVISCDAAEFPGAPLRALREAFCLHARTLGASTPKALLSLVREASPEGAGAAPALRWFLDSSAAPGAAPARSDLVRAVGALLRALLGERPAVLAVDDAHLLDEATLDVLAYAAGEARSWPLVLVVAFRPPALARENAAFAVRLPGLRAVPGARSFVLGPLSEGAVASLVHRGLRLSEEESCRLGPLLHRKSGGNPLYLLECMRLLEEEGRITEDRSGRRLRQRVTSLALPPRLREVALRRLVGLSGEERELLGAVSVDPAGLPAAILAACLDGKERDVLRLLQRLVAERGLAARSDRGFRIPHAEIRDAVYADLIPELRTAYHGEAARGLEAAGLSAAEPARLARHWRLGGEPGKAVPLYVAAARALREAQSPAEALALIEEARSTPEGRAHFEAAVERTLALEATGEADSARRELRALADGAEGDHRFRALVVLCRFERDHGSTRKAWKILVEAGPLARTPEQRLRLAVDRAQTASKMGKFKEALRSLEEAGKQNEGREPDSLRLQFHFTKGSVLWRSGNASGARETWTQALAEAESLGDAGTAASLLSNLSLACEDLGLRGEALLYARKAVDRAYLLGASRPLVHGLLQVANLQTHDLALEEAEAALLQAGRFEEGLRNVGLQVQFSGTWSSLELARSRPGEALRWIRTGLEHAKGNPRYEGELRIHAARALMELDLPEDVLLESRAALQALGEDGDAEHRQEAKAMAAWALRALDRPGPEAHLAPMADEWCSAEAAAIAARLARDASASEALARAARRMAGTPLLLRSVERLLARPVSTSRSGGSPCR